MNIHDIFNFNQVALAPGEVLNTWSGALDGLLGHPAYLLINWFFMFSFLGYILECIVLTIENKQLVTNRGFCHLPLCIIYGFCAVTATVVMSPLLPSPFLVYMASMTFATLAELITARMMIRLFGGFWWDYSNKRFNYKGMISLETSLGWGLVGIIFFYFASDRLFAFVGLLPATLGIVVAAALLVTYVVDFIYCSYRRITGQETDMDGIGRKKVEENV